MIKAADEGKKMKLSCMDMQIQNFPEKGTCTSHLRQACYDKIFIIGTTHNTHQSMIVWDDVAARRESIHARSVGICDAPRDPWEFRVNDKLQQYDWTPNSAGDGSGDGGGTRSWKMPAFCPYRRRPTQELPQRLFPEESKKQLGEIELPPIC